MILNREDGSYTDGEPDERLARVYAFIRGALLTREDGVDLNTLVALRDYKGWLTAYWTKIPPIPSRDMVNIAWEEEGLEPKYNVTHVLLTAKRISGSDETSEDELLKALFRYINND